MAEGHAVHGMARRINQLQGQLVRSTSTPEFDAAAFDLTHLEAAEAHGKHLLVRCREVEQTVHLHLGMLGRVQVRASRRALGDDGLPRTAPPEPPGLRWRLLSAHYVLNVIKPVVCEVLEPSEVDALHARLGPDPLRPADSPDAFIRKASASRRPIGLLVIDQSVVAGIGNVYRAEILHRLRIDPFTPGRELDESLLRAIWDEARDLLSLGLEAGWIITHPDQTHAARELVDRGQRVPRWRKTYFAYGRAHQPCLICQEPIAARQLGQQRLFWCPSCQGTSRRSNATGPASSRSAGPDCAGRGQVSG